MRQDDKYVPYQKQPGAQRKLQAQQQQRPVSDFFTKVTPLASESDTQQRQQQQQGPWAAWPQEENKQQVGYQREKENRVLDAVVNLVDSPPLLGREHSSKQQQQLEGMAALTSSRALQPPPQGSSLHVGHGRDARGGLVQPQPGHYQHRVPEEQQRPQLQQERPEPVRGKVQGGNYGGC